MTTLIIKPLHKFLARWSCARMRISLRNVFVVCSAISPTGRCVGGCVWVVGKTGWQTDWAALSFSERFKRHYTGVQKAKRTLVSSLPTRPPQRHLCVCVCGGAVRVSSFSATLVISSNNPNKTNMMVHIPLPDDEIIVRLMCIPEPPDSQQHSPVRFCALSKKRSD